jgi:hypothetical protein
MDVTALALERLGALAGEVQRLQERLSTGTNHPPMVLVRLTLAADSAAAELSELRERLTEPPERAQGAKR